MKDATDYQPAQQFGLLLIGPSGTGKSTLAMSFPDPYFIDCDRNLRSAITRHPGKTFWYDAPELDEAGKRLPEHEVWSNIRRLMEKNMSDARVKTGVVDGLTRINDWLMAHVMKQGSDMEPRGIKVGGLQMMTTSYYLPYARELTRFLLDLRSYGKPIIVTAHVRSGENELTDAPNWQPFLVGGLRNTLPHLFTDYWMTDTEQQVPGPTTTGTTDKPGPYPTGVKYFVRTAPRPQITLKNSLGLPPVFEFTWAAFEPYLRRADAVAVTSSTPAPAAKGTP